MKQVDLIWLSYHENILARNYWDQGLLEDTFKRGNFNHFTNFAQDNDNGPKGAWRLGDGAVVVLNGRSHTEDIERINNDIAKLRWCLLIITGDEESLFPFEQIKHPLLRLWIQLPRMNKHNDVSFKLPNGYRPDTHDRLSEIGYKEKLSNYFFAGQITHARRENCRDAMDIYMEIDNAGQFIKTKKFGEQAVHYGDYLSNLASTKIAICPSGPQSPDTFRLYEALEAGCLPVVDAFASNNQDLGFWKYLFGDGIPFPILDYWANISDLMPELLRDYPANANRAFAWWQLKKREIYWKLIDDIEEISYE